MSEENLNTLQPAFLTNQTFSGFNLPPRLTANLEGAGFSRCTPIQKEVIPLALKGQDVAGQAQTGTGKTLAFLVPILAKLINNPPSRDQGPSALMLAPTRELAIQIYDDAIKIIDGLELTALAVYGGMDYRKQADDLRAGVDLIIGTPGRIIDYMKQGIIKTDDITNLVVDEADRFMDLGFIKDLRFILRKLPNYRRRQSMLFSATLHYRVLELTYEYMNMPEFVSVTPEEITVKNIKQSLIHVGRDEKFNLLLGLFKREEPERTLVFVNTKAGVEMVARRLAGNGLNAVGITGDLPQVKRLKVMRRFKDEGDMILVATDVASRGIHVDDVAQVINYDIPLDPENYVHRIGRTARAGKEGRSVTLACEELAVYLEPMESFLGYKIETLWPEDDWFAEDKSPRYDPRPRDRSGRSGGRGRSQGSPTRRGEGDRRPRPARRSETEKPVKAEPAPEKEPTPQAAVALGEAQPAPPKKRRRRRPRKRGGSTGQPQAVAAEVKAAPEEKTAPPEGGRPSNQDGEKKSRGRSRPPRRRGASQPAEAGREETGRPQPRPAPEKPAARAPRKPVSAPAPKRAPEPERPSILSKVKDMLFKPKREPEDGPGIFGLAPTKNAGEDKRPSRRGPRPGDSESDDRNPSQGRPRR